VKATEESLRWKGFQKPVEPESGTRVSHQPEGFLSAEGASV
jgi:hypothetical protein